MRSDIISQEKNEVIIKATIDAADFKKDVNQTVRELSAKVNIPGFRKGRVPRNVLELRFGKESIHAETLEKVMPKVMEQLVRDYELELIAEPDLNVDVMEEGKDLELTFTFEVRPEVTLPEFDKIEVEKLKVNVTEEMVNDAIKEVQKQQSELDLVGRPSADGDSIVAEFKTTVLNEDGTEKASHAPETNTFDLGYAELRSEIKEALTGVSAGESVTAEIQIELEYPDKEIAGKTVRYDFTVKEVKERMLPQLGPDFFKKVLHKDVATFDDFKVEMRGQLQERMQKESEQLAENSAVAKLCDKAEVDLPETLILRQIEHLTEQNEQNIKNRYKKSLEDYLKDASISREDYDRDIREQAKQGVKQYLVMEVLGENLGIEVSREDIDEELAGMASSYKIDEATLKSILFKDKEKISEMANSIRLRKIMSSLMSKIKLTEVDKFTETETTETTGSEDK